MRRVKKSVAVFLSLCLCVLCMVPAFAQERSDGLAEHCVYMGDFNADGQITAVDARGLLQTASLVRECTAEILQRNDVNGDGQITAVDARWVLQMAAGLRGWKSLHLLTGEIEDLTATGQPFYTKEEAVAAVCAWTAAASKASYTVNGVCSLTDDVDMGGATDVLNRVIAQVDPAANVNSVFGLFLGVDEVNYQVHAGNSDAQTAKYDLKAFTFTPADVAEYRQEGDKLYFRLYPCTNPQSGTTTLSRVTNAFLTEAELQQLLEDTGNSSLIAIGDLQQDISDILVTVTVAQNQITALQIQFADAVELELKASSVSIAAKGPTQTVLAYSGFVY